MATRDGETLVQDVLGSDAERNRVETNGIELHVVTAGPSDGDPLLLLHGFPEFWYGWRSQISTLADAGYRVIVPDQRGYNRSDKPGGIDAYTSDILAADVVGLLDALEYDQVQAVGHDWGAIVLWETLLRHADRIERAVPMNVPHPQVFETFLTGNPRQLLKSWYVFFFQLPSLPEWVCSADDWRVLETLMDTANRPDAFTPEDMATYRRAWSRPDAFTAMVNWYRALIQGNGTDPPTHVVDVPTMVIWGMQDPYLEREMAPESAKYCTNGRLELLEDATHWLHHEQPGRINDLLLSFLE